MIIEKYMSEGRLVNTLVLVTQAESGEKLKPRSLKLVGREYNFVLISYL